MPYKVNAHAHMFTDILKERNMGDLLVAHVEFLSIHVLIAGTDNSQFISMAQKWVKLIRLRVLGFC